MNPNLTINPHPNGELVLEAAHKIEIIWIKVIIKL